MTDVQDTIAWDPGFRLGIADAGLRKQPAPDLVLVMADNPCTAAGVFTTNHVKAAPVILDMERLKDHPERIRAVLVNAGCANACTGAEGMANAQQTAAWVAAEIGCQPDEVLVMSTGVIGTQLPMEKMRSGIEQASRSLLPEQWKNVYRPDWDHIRASQERLAQQHIASDAWEKAARAIMTTDTKPKLASVTKHHIPPGIIQDSLEERDFIVAGMAKGAGMIAPNMATMLAVLVTDVEISADLLHECLVKAVDQSFNRIVVDGDMSTNDTVLILANGGGNLRVSKEPFDSFRMKSDQEAANATVKIFTEALTEVCVALAKKIVRDGEGASKFIELQIVGAASEAEAHRIGNTIATSPLVKTAFYGGDANWGRILAAAGRAGVELDQTRLSLWYDDLQLVANGTPLTYDEDRANALAGQPEVTVKLDLGRGSAEATIWTCDLSHDYVSINGHYRT